jgi:PAS domain S-box-containing protein
MEALATRQDEQGRPDDPKSAAAQSKPALVYVDAAPAARALVEMSLADTYTVDAFATADEAVAAMHTRRPAAIVADLDLPEGGVELVRKAKGNAALARIPFILVAGDERDAARGLELGADDFLPKPYGPEHLRARIAVAIRWAQAFHTLQSQHAELVWVHDLLGISDGRTRAILETSSDAILLLGLDGTVLELNPAASRAFGVDEHAATGMSFIEELVAARSREGVREDLARALAGQSPAVRAGFALRSGGGEFPMECRVTRIESKGRPDVCVFLRDSTEAKRLEVELHQAQKLEAVGRLAAGIAHEINTPIQFIGDNARFLEEAFAATSAMLERLSRAVEDVPAPEAIRASLENAREELDLSFVLEQVPKSIARTLDGVQRVATIVRAMKEFAHPDQKEMVATDLNRALHATLEVARNEYKYVADVETDFAPLPLVTCHAGDVNQLFLNLIVNAAHAIADVVKGTTARGVIRVRTRCEGEVVEVAIADTGSGIPERIRDKIFEPFFTTKEVGRGTGQGLAIARNVVDKHRGSIRFETSDGKGSTFSVRLPVAPPAPSPKAVA